MNLAIDLYCGLGGWTEGLLSAGYRVVGFDITRHVYGESKYPGQLVLQDTLTIHGSQFKNADLIVASPPCQNYSYLAMPWSRSTDPNNSQAAKSLRKKWEAEGPDNRLFDACFRIQREACEAAGRYIPLIVENVRGAVPWVGPAKAKFGSFYLWGDVAQIGDRVYAGSDLADMRFGGGVAPESGELKGYGSTWFGIQNNGDTYDQRSVNPVSGQKRNPDGTAHPQGSWFRVADSSQGDRGQKREGRNFHTYALSGGTVWYPSYHGGEHETRGVGMGVKVPGQIQGKEYAMCRTGAAGQKTLGHVNKRDGNGHTRHLTNQSESDAVREGSKIGGDWFSDPNSTCRKHGSRSNARKQASAMIAKIPFALSSYVARVHLPGGHL